MGNYNPDAPYILGNEWTPIRTADYQPDSITERGYSFSIEHTVTPVSGAYMVSSIPGANGNLGMVMSVYPEGAEALSGPVKALTIPASAIEIIGVGAQNVALIQNPGNTSGIALASLQNFLINFDTVGYSQPLFGKRILGLEFLYVVYGDQDSLAAAFVSQALGNPLSSSLGIQQGLDGVVLYHSETSKVPMSPLNIFWNGSVAAAGEAQPWKYTSSLTRLAATEAGATRLSILLGAGTSNGITLNYAGLRVIYCEEKRVKIGTRRLSGAPNVVGANMVVLRDIAQTQTGTLTPGRYTVTVNSETITNLPAAAVPPYLRALRELYQLPPQPGVTVGKTLTVNDEFTYSQTPVLVPLSLHTASAVVTGIHPYGVQNGAAIYGTITASQDVHEDDTAASQAYPQARFYARRFGNTTAPLTLTAADQGNMTVTITVAEFDALPEIVDGWKEVNLRFTTAPVFPTASTNPNYIWSAAGEIASNQWQVLSAFAVSPAQTIAPATYQAPAGATDLLAWQTTSPPISGVASDAFSDATILLSTDPPAITGFALSTCVQAITGVSMSCGVPKGCIPTGIYGNQVSWANGIICDTYSRDVTGGWGTADTGQAWITDTGAAAQFGVSGGRGLMTHTAANTTLFQRMASPAADVDVKTTICTPVLTTGDVAEFVTNYRYTNASNRYFTSIVFRTTGVVSLTVSRTVAGVTTDLGTMNLPFTYTGDTCIRVRAQVVGSALRSKAWLDGEPEPGWEISVTDSSLTAAGSVGMATFVSSGNTNTMPLTFKVDDFQAVPATFADGFYEIQRYDSVDGFWSTILDTANLCVTGMCDFEARVGVPSIYRMRTRNVMDFAGPWVSGSATLPSPGVATSGDGNSTLIFTSNKAPLGNLAYTMQWEGTAIEQFAFPEADTVQLQRMFGRDFFVAFRPLERGGERFQRTILVSAAAIPLESLANFRGLRDLAWADLPYVCVRDELGNRWYATVLVPTGEVRRDRTLYFAQIEVIEVSNTPCPLDP